MRSPALLALLVMTSSTAALAAPWTWEAKDDQAGACAFTYAAPTGAAWKAKPFKDGKLTFKKSGAELTILAVAAKTTAAKYVAKALEDSWMSDCGDVPKAEDVGGWTCGASGGCNGMWEMAVCAQTQPHPDGGEQLVVLTVSTDPKNTADAGGIKELAAAGAKVTGLKAKLKKK